MFSFLSIVCLFIGILHLSANPIVNNSNETIEIETSTNQSQSLCDRNIYLAVNQSLFEVESRFSKNKKRETIFRWIEFSY